MQYMGRRNNYSMGLAETEGWAVSWKKWLHMNGGKNLICFWLLGVGIDFGYWAIVTAAHDLLTTTERSHPGTANLTTRQCNHKSAGIIMVINVVPNLIMKMVLPFLPLWVHFRTFVAIIMSVVGFALAAYKQTDAFILTGVALSSISVGMGESTYLMYIPYFKDKRIVAAWSSGTGFSGFLASLTYLGLINGGVSLSTTLYIMIVAPVMMGLVFWLFLHHPKVEKIDKAVKVEDGSEQPDYVTSADTTTFLKKFKILYKLLFTYSIPFFLVFLFQFTINSGIFELLYFKNSLLDQPSYIRLFNFIFLLSVLISRSSGSLKIDYLWSMVVLQGLNLGLLVTQSMYGWMGKYGFWIVVVIIFWEGLVSGVSYINTYRKMNVEVPVEQRQFSMSINSVGASLGMLLAGLVAIPLHNYICDLPLP